ncbi:flippase [Methanobrevibacter sp.]|uniref:flippase n=1 Tax=Methanobrevibacter sp. TaxID=66852 RepID=UPI00257A4FF0|nr:flippase [Methanobrevibacter sp.]MBR2666436.1 flippase [Methanobrevibacter sp.]
MSNKVLKNSFILVIGNLLFRVGGYINRLLMSRMLGPEGYGLYGLTLPFQGIFQILSAGGLPPAISKYVAEYNAKDEKALTRQVIYTATKFMVLMAILLSIILLFSSDFIANEIFHKPLVVWPLRAVSLITPFSVIVGAMRGAFQGVYKNEYTVYNRMAEQLATIVFAVVFVYCGLYAMGAVLGGAFGFIVSAITAVLLYKKYISPMFYSEDSLDLSLKEELELLWMLICFAVPVAITALSEMAIYDVGTLVIGVFMLSTDVGFYNAADPISRIPLVISLSISTVLLPATAEAYVLKNQKLLQEYVVDCLRYCILTVIPMCVIISMFSMPIIQLLFGEVYTPGSGVLCILVIGMSFYSIYMISSSILQGTGNPKLPMYILLLGTVLNIVLNAIFVQMMGIVGAAIATTITTCILMIVIMLFVIKTTKISIPWKNILLVLICNLILMAVCYVIPKTLIGLVIGIIIGSSLYIVSLIMLKVLTKRDIDFFSQYMNKIPILKKYTPKLVKYIEEKGLICELEE